MRPTPCLFNSLFLTAGVMLAAPTLHAEEVVENSSPAVTELDTSFVTATGAATDIRDAPASVSVISREEIERQPVYDLNTLLRRVPGVTGGFGPVGEQSKIKLRGLDDKYTLILVDGKRVGSSADTSYRRDLARQDLNWIAPSMIERIEIVRGPMSSLYGSDAMGGVINIITRKVSKTWSGSASTNITVPKDSDRGQTTQNSLNLAGPLTDSLGLRLGANVTRRAADEVEPRRDAAGDYMYGDGAGGSKDHSVNALLDWKINDEQSLSLEAVHGVERSWSSKKTFGDYGETIGEGFGAGRLIRDSYVLSHTGDWSFGSTKLDAYLNKFKNDIEWGKANSEEKIVEGSLNLPFEWLVNQSLTLGGQWKREELTNSNTLGTVPVDYQGNPVNGSSLKADYSAAFIEDELFLLDNLSLTLGNRFDHSDEYGNHNSPRAYLVYHPHPDWTVRGGISKGFRAPSLKEGSAGAATESGGRGCGSLVVLGYGSGSCWMAGNPNLTPETSTNKEVGVSFDHGGWEAGLTYFHTDFTDKIEYAALGEYQGRWWTMLENVDKARTRGWEGTTRVPLGDSVDWRTNATYMLESRNLSTGEDLISSPKLSLFSAINWQVNDQLNTELSAQHVGKQRGIGDDFTQSYTTYDLTANLALTKWLSLNAGVQNLLDEDPRDGATNFYVPGRAFFAGATTYF
ncbi:TonB-dependent receptor [Pseudomonas sp. TH05]|uniref:TonB-dependent receptor domain-containing protein n=1 Tax=unclassified Pseudomonas TaxID=196821 RepID=UPI001911D00F|nr:MULTISPECIES: TonB-dependent receptor [unclassified Pseudomonas]MBK5537082.1 TonB-dependent receptor [Pseudomonas sp. TH07]MBK5559955.1 TonB-dependent receptor [Pseudomonas sp. TH05]